MFTAPADQEGLHLLKAGLESLAIWGSTLVMSLPCTGKTKVGTKWQWEVQVEPKKRQRKKDLWRKNRYWSSYLNGNPICYVALCCLLFYFPSSLYFVSSLFCMCSIDHHICFSSIISMSMSLVAQDVSNSKAFNFYFYFYECYFSYQLSSNFKNFSFYFYIHCQQNFIFYLFSQIITLW
jgi:hypothetical protein